MNALKNTYMCVLSTYVVLSAYMGIHMMNTLRAMYYSEYIVVGLSRKVKKLCTYRDLLVSLFDYILMTFTFVCAKKQEQKQSYTFKIQKQVIKLL